MSTKNLIKHKYRPDIDGLRAIAVLSVVGFHAFPESDIFKAGFIGVDIFFVISGFLISSIIYEKFEEDSFSFVDFYTRRVLRIFPALLLVLLACFIFGWFALLPTEYKDIGKHMAGAAGFVSNLLLWQESGYFDVVSENKPLLHLWSLGVEEQFYIAWSLILWLAYKARINLLITAIALAVISFYLNISGVQNDPSATFYSPQTRFWELLAGATLAYVVHKRTQFTAASVNALFGFGSVSNQYDISAETKCEVRSALGLILFIIGFFAISKENAFPGYWAALPVLGAVLVISAGQQAWFNRSVLSNPALISIGIISYPLYLWHWPILSFARIIEGELPSETIRWAAVATSIFLAWATYRLFEKPLRFGSGKNIKAMTMSALMLFFGVTGYITYDRNGLDYRGGVSSGFQLQGDIGFDELESYIQANSLRCKSNSNGELEINNISVGRVGCLHSAGAEEPDIIIIGDSHSGHLFLGLSEELTNLKVASLSLYGINGLPYINNSYFDKAFSYILKSRAASVVISSYWANPQLDLIGNTANDGLLKTVESLTRAGKMVYISDDVPNFSFDPAICKHSRKFSTGQKCDEDAKKFHSSYTQYMEAIVKASSSNKNVKIIKTSEGFCNAGTCSMKKDGKLMFADRNHLNMSGSRYVAKIILASYPELRLKRQPTEGQSSYISENK